MATGGQRRVAGLAAWFVTEALLPGATVFLLLLWLSQRFVRQGFGDMRQYALPPLGGSSVRSAQRNWWSCTCGTIAACACLTAVRRNLRRCCSTLFQFTTLRIEPGAARSA